jgi:hypothetical protein
MTTHTLHPAALRAQLAGLTSRIRDGESPVIAFRSNMWNGPETIEVDSRTWHVKGCRSVLEVRDALSSRDEAQPLVILTQVSHADLGPDVTARLLKRRILEVDAWEPVLRVFGAHRIDARLASHGWLSDVLVTGAPAQGYDQSASGTLDAATAWRAALKILLGVDASALDLTTLLEWTLDASVLSRWAALPQEQTADICKWLISAVGPSAELPLALIKNNHGADVVPIAIVCGVLFADGEELSGVRGAAAIRLERWTDGLHVDGRRARAVATTANRLLERLRTNGRPGVSALLGRADEVLSELGSGDEAWRSRWLSRGFDQRLQHYADALMVALNGAGVAAALVAAADALENLRVHSRGTDDPERVLRAEQALRLVRYIRTVDHTAPPTSFGDAAAAYSSVHAFADVSRYALYASETHQGFGAALTAVADRSASERESFTKTFASLTKHWFDAPSPTPNLVLIEDALKTVVAPLAEHGPVLLVVVDGMSAAVADAVGASVQRRGWTPIAPVDVVGPVALVGALPSITAVCRTSLFCGALRKGTASDERSGFASQTNLVALSKPNLPPRVFHKGDLGAGASLADDVAAAIAAPLQRIVAVVVNAVDDYLLKDDMVRPTWTADYVPVVAALCDAARTAGRFLVMTADHGHVLDLKLSEKLPGNDSDRYRSAGPPLRNGEVLVSGPRVLTESGTVVVAASERIRYMSRKNGYHGGISPQELIIPLLVFAPETRMPVGYREAGRSRPAWWDLTAPVGEAPIIETAIVTSKTGLPLFDQPVGPALAVTTAIAPAWVARLLHSEVFQEQKRRAARAALADDRLSALLVTLASRGGRMTSAAVADRLGIPVGRVSSTIAAAAQMLNFDGYQVLFLDSDEIVLDQALLITQFELED